MRTKLFGKGGISLLGLILVADSVLAHPPPPPKASETQVTAGTNNSAYVTPYLLRFANSNISTVVTYNTNVYNNYTNFYNEIYVTNNSYFQGKTTFNSNVFLTTVSYSTNAAASEGVIDLSKNYRAFSTNNNTSFTGLAGIEAARTNIQTVNIFITNSSAAAKTITMAAAFQNMNASEGNTLYVTNVGHLLVFFYQGFGTNFYFKSR